MPEGLVRTDANKTGTTFRDGTPVTLPVNFGTDVNLPHEFGIPLPVSDPTFNSNPVDWQTPDPAHFGNIVGTETQQATPTFTPDGGTYNASQDVTIASPGADTIYYTTDGSIPTNPPTGTTLTYSGPVTVATDLVLQAIAVRAGFLDSQVGAAAYTIAVPMALLVHAAAGSNSGTTVTTPVRDTTGATLLIVAFANYCGTNFAKSVTDSKGNNWHLLTEYDAGGNTNLPTASILIAYAFDKGAGLPLAVGSGHTISGIVTGGDTNAICMQAWSGNTPTLNPFISGSDHGVTASTGGGGLLIAPGNVTPSSAGDVLITAIGFAPNSDPAVDSGFSISDFIRSTSEHCGLAYIIASTGATLAPTWTLGFAGAMTSNVAGFRRVTTN